MRAIAGIICMLRKVVGPSTPGIMTSMRMASGCCAVAIRDAFAAGAGGEDLPAGSCFKGECGDLADVVFVVDDEDASHRCA